MKKGRLSKKEIEFIHDNKDKDIKLIALELDRSEDIVKEILKREKPVKTNPKNLFGRKDGATVMTEQAGFVSDSRRGKTSVRESDPNVIFKPLG